MLYERVFYGLVLWRSSRTQVRLNPAGLQWSASSVSIARFFLKEADNVFDINNSKDFYARIGYKIGGMGVLGVVQ
ncbi:MAG: hypothetical protein DWB56_16975 [Candidatus Jettenia sp.]|uniref:hypothetical protein n=1 Tax=Candidatus Jettenia sp. AMX1 TaxID=2293637 RepID=UPI000591571C|nr:hypothetical protein [Candidatus Jettenia sp. AMX1]MBC6930609.1 hypothetical protein [Candidatus Jettenia sp.]MCQ3928736.1 hypothetical protein [Candidatus Jettenia sp.]MDL1940604.1 hypothetical protein [Candidatus Jettenia sp. AMX1]WKZ15641.1 MAG: hypothetical protein QY317_17255 [Candidatus Jettenia caeni]